jgi:MraZ protein
MLLTGAYHRNLDDKFRLALPKPVREALGDGAKNLFVAPGTDGSLNIYTETVLLELGETLARKSPVGEPSRAFSRLFYSQIQPTEPDAQGRIRIPVELVQWAKLEGEVVLVGVRDHLELWSSSRWDAFLADRQAAFDQLAVQSFADSGEAGN